MMDIIDIIIKLYSRLHNYTILPFWFFTPIRRLVRLVANLLFPILLAKKRYHTKREIDVIVSFTSFPARIDNVWQVVECILRQTFLPKKIILWLSNKQFSSFDDLPISLKDLVDNRFEIRFVNDDIRSHKKYHYVSKEYPDSLIFLIDDDLYYPSDILENTYIKYCSMRDSVIGNYGYEISFNSDGSHKAYSSWNEIVGSYEGKYCFLGSGGGTMFKPSMMYKDFLKKDLALSLTPIADDIWFNAMAELNNTKKIIINAGLVLAIKSKNDVLLYKSNVVNGANDSQLHNIEEYYKEKGLFSRK